VTGPARLRGLRAFGSGFGHPAGGRGFVSAARTPSSHGPFSFRRSALGPGSIFRVVTGSG